jgi:outer membrane lipoprotein-sorting protein
MSKKTLPVLAAAVLLTGVAMAEEPTADGIISKHIEARGGQEAIEAVESAKVVGSMNMGGMEVPITILWQRPDKIRMEMTIQGQVGVQAFDGATGWMHMPFMGKAEPETMPEDAVEAMKEQADMIEGELYGWEDKGYQVEYLGMDEFEGSEVYEIKVTRDEGNVENVHLIDPDSYLEIGTESKRTVQGQEMAMIASFGSFKEVGGLVIPHSMEMKAKGAPEGTPGQALTIESIELNQPVDAAQFAFPGATEPAAAAEPGGA